MRITIANAKGGVGKTTSAIYLPQAASLRGHRAVVLDADPQGSASQWADMAAQENQPLDFNVLPANPATLKRPRKTDRIEIVDAAPTGTALAVAMETADFTIIPAQTAPWTCSKPGRPWRQRKHQRPSSSSASSKAPKPSKPS